MTLGEALDMRGNCLAAQRTIRVLALERPHLMTVRDELLAEAEELEIDIDLASAVISAALGEMG